MSENLFQPIYVFWTSFIVLLVNMVLEGVKELAQCQSARLEIKKLPKIYFFILQSRLQHTSPDCKKA